MQRNALGDGSRRHGEDDGLEMNGSSDEDLRRLRGASNTEECYIESSVRSDGKYCTTKSSLGCFIMRRPEPMEITPARGCWDGQEKDEHKPPTWTRKPRMGRGPKN